MLDRESGEFVLLEEAADRKRKRETGRQAEEEAGSKVRADSGSVAGILDP